MDMFNDLFFIYIDSILSLKNYLKKWMNVLKYVFAKKHEKSILKNIRHYF